jgi:hypothetical protein
MKIRVQWELGMNSTRTGGPHRHGMFRMTGRAWGIGAGVSYHDAVELRKGRDTTPHSASLRRAVDIDMAKHVTDFMLTDVVRNLHRQVNKYILTDKFRAQVPSEFRSLVWSWYNNTGTPVEFGILTNFLECYFPNIFSGCQLKQDYGPNSRFW